MKTAKTLSRRPDTLEEIGDRLGAVHAARRRNLSAAIACACAAVALGSYGAHQAGRRAELAAGSREADASSSMARRAQGLWDPSRGYAAMSGRAYQSQSEWGASASFEAIPDGSGLAVEYAYASQAQCVGLVEGAALFFDQVFVDRKPAKPPAGDSSACSAMGQNQVRLVKIETRASSAELFAGRRDNRGGVSPAPAAPATEEQRRMARPGALSPLSASGAEAPPKP